MTILPGFGQPLDSKGDRPLFKNALDCEGTEMKLITLREFMMMRLMNEITEKPEWNKKIFDDGIVAKWKNEVISQPDVDITDSMFTYCIAELHHKTADFEKSGYIAAYDGDVLKSDLAISGLLKDALRKTVAPLEIVTNESQLDWHPNSDEKVLDLVHPSLFPVVYGRTRILPDGSVGLDDCVKRCGEGKQLELPQVENAATMTSRYYNDAMSPYSQKFQWLPCDVMFRNGDKPEITSYINNLHPTIHRPLYGVIEQVLEHTIPLWSAALRHSHQCGTSTRPRQRIAYSRTEYDIDENSLPPELESIKPQPTPDEDKYDYMSRLSEWVAGKRKLILPEPEVFQPLPDGASNTCDLGDEFKESGLQVIVKFANIHLTPEKPDYEGGTWHVEGQLNEHICASAIYYYDIDNITESRLAFRQQTSDGHARDVSYDQDDHGWLHEIFGCEQDGPATQEIGNVIAKEGRLITWPNTLQHKVLPFSLADRTKSGHRKILALFLVDPHIRIISSANVPCQRRDWWEAELSNTQREGGLFPRRLPEEMVHEIVKNVSDFPLGMEEAKELRLELMQERRSAAYNQNALFESDTFSLCEH